MTEPKKNKEKFPFKKKKKKKIKIPFEDLTSLPSEEEYGDEFH
ncbi:MAG: hypothetical protein ABH850_05235 [Candidatus Micrarchaeota archaeon]